MMTLHEVFISLEKIVTACENEDIVNARYEARRLKDFIQNARVLPILSNDQEM